MRILCRQLLMTPHRYHASLEYYTPEHCAPEYYASGRLSTVLLNSLSSLLRQQ